MSTFYVPSRQVYRWLPPVEADIITGGLWKRWSEKRKQSTFPIHCMRCQVEVSWFDAVGINISRRGRRDAKVTEARGNVVVGTLVHLIDVMRVEPNHDGPDGIWPLEVCSYKVIPMTLRGYGCIKCQRMTMLNGVYFDMRREIKEYAESTPYQEALTLDIVRRSDAVSSFKSVVPVISQVPNQCPACDSDITLPNGNQPQGVFTCKQCKTRLIRSAYENYPRVYGLQGDI